MKNHIIIILLFFVVVLVPPAYSQTELEFTFTTDKYSYDEGEHTFMSATTNILNSEIYVNAIHHPYIGENGIAFLNNAIPFDDNGVIDNYLLSITIGGKVNGTYTVIGSISGYDCEFRAVTFQYGEIENKELKDSAHFIRDKNNNLQYDIEKINTECKMKRDYVILPPIISIDKKSYDIHDTITITGHSENTDVYKDEIQYSLTSPHNNFKISQGSITSDINSDFYYEISISDLVNFDYDKKKLVPITSGNYTIELNHRGSNLTSIQFQITGKIYSPVITFQTDKSEYYIDDQNVIVHGTINDVNWSKDTSINYTVTNTSGIIESGITTLQNNETFGFTINTDSELWDNYEGSVSISVTMQNDTKTSHFYYYNTLDMSPELLYKTNMDQNERLDNQKSEITELREDVDSLQVQLDNLTQFINEQFKIIMNILSGNNTSS